MRESNRVYSNWEWNHLSLLYGCCLVLPSPEQNENIHAANDAFVDFDGCIHTTFPIVQLTVRLEIVVCMSYNNSLMDFHLIYSAYLKPTEGSPKESEKVPNNIRIKRRLDRIAFNVWIRKEFRWFGVHMTDTSTNWNNSTARSKYQMSNNSKNQNSNLCFSRRSGT